MGRRGLPLVVAIACASALLPGSEAWAGPTCTARPGLRRAQEYSLAWCVGDIDPGGTITLQAGEHLAPKVEINKPMILEGDATGRTVVRYDGSLGLGALESLILEGLSYLDVTSPLFEVRLPSGEELTVRNIRVQPITNIPSTGATYLYGRAFQVWGGTLVLEQVELVPFDLDESGTIDPGELGTAPTEIGSADRRGGVLVRASESGRVVLRDVLVDGLVAPTLVGAAVWGEGSEVQVILEGQTQFRSMAAWGGAVHVGNDADLIIRERDGVLPLFLDIDGSELGAVHVGGGATAGISGRFQGNTLDRDATAGQIRYSGGAHLTVESGAHASILGGSFVDGEAPVGGAVLARNATLTIQGGTFERCRARLGGHVAVLREDDSLNEAWVDVQAGTFVGGTADVTAEEAVLAAAAREEGRFHPFAMGGSLFIGNAPSTVDGGSFSQSDAWWGGGIAVLAPVSDVRLQGMVIRDNNATEDGGGVWSRAASLRVIGGTEAEFTSNTAGNQGGHLFVAGDVGAAGTDWTAVSLEAGDGLGDGLELSGGDAENGGAVFAQDAGVEVVGRGSVEGLVAVTFAGNQATSSGGALRVQEGHLRATLSEFFENRADQGGAVASEASDLDLGRSAFGGNTAADRGGAVAAGGDGRWHVLANVFLANASPSGADLYLLGPSGGLGNTWVANNLFDGTGGAGDSRIWIQNRGGAFDHNDLVRASGVGVAVGGEATLDIGYNLFGWLDGASPAVAFQGAPDAWEHDNAYHPDRAGLVLRDGDAVAPDPSSVLEHPHLRGALRDGPQELSALRSTHHPRPTSPLLLGGYPGGGVDSPQGQLLIGMFGGEEPFPGHWDLDADGDGIQRIWDCDDDPATAGDAIGDRFIQYLDEDGDGVGGVLWEGDACELLPALSDDPGDCDDSNPDLAEVCKVSFYGSACSQSPHAGWLGLLLPLLWMRRRRR